MWTFYSSFFRILSLESITITHFTDVFDAVERGRTTYGIVPFENSTHGSVIQTLDRFIDTEVRIRAEAYLTVSYC